MVSALPINTGNTVDVRRLLDETLFDVIKECGYEENTYWGNIKLVIMAAACAIAAFAQFNPWEFPDNRWVLGACCVAYATLSIVLQVIVSFVDQDYVLFCHPKTGSQIQAEKIKGVGIRANLESFDHHYTLSVQTLHDKSDTTGTQDKPLVECKLSSEKTSIGNYFDTNGYFYEEEFAEEVKKLLKDFESKIENTSAPRNTDAESKKKS